MSKYLNPFTDYGFKKLFGEPSSQEALISFLNELLREENLNIVSLNYLPSEQLPDDEDQRRSVIDLYCHDQNGRHFLIEMQRIDHLNFKSRLLYYATFPIRQQAKRGHGTFNLTPSSWFPCLVSP